MIILLRKFNYGNRRLVSLFTGECVNVRNVDGTFSNCCFLGFAERTDAVESKAKPVKLEIYGYYPDGMGSGLIQLDFGQAVQGALTAVGVYAVVENGKLRIISMY